METTKKIYPVNDRVALERCTKEILADFKNKFPENYKIDFLERNTVISKIESDNVVEPVPETNISNEVINEVKIYNTALENTKKAINWCLKSDIKIHRPTDFYAEMFKSDAHMEKVKGKLENKKNSLIKRERERLNKKQKKFQKQLRHKKNLDAAKEKKKNLEAIDKWKGEIKKHKDNAKDLDSFVNEKGGKGSRQNFVDKENRGKGGRQKFGGKENRGKGKIAKKSDKKRPGKVSRNKSNVKGKGKRRG